VFNKLFSVLEILQETIVEFPREILKETVGEPEAYLKKRGTFEAVTLVKWVILVNAY